MTDESKRHSIAEIPMVLPVPDPSQVVERHGIEYGRGEEGALALDLYLPAGRGAVALPVVILVAGYSDVGYARFVGCRFKDTAMAQTWARIATSFGLAAITYGNARPIQDLDALLAHVRGHAADLGVDRDRIGLWALSGNGPLALSALAGAPRASFRCGVFSCAYLADLEGATHVAEAAKQWTFVNPGVEIETLPADLPIFIARAGQEPDPGLNHAVDRFVGAALARNLPVTCVSFPEAPHAFELFHDTAATRDVMRQMFRFARFHLTAAP